MREIVDLEGLRLAYLNGNRRTKGEILQALVKLHKYHRKSAIRLLNAEVNRMSQGKPRGTKRRGRRPQYRDEAFKEVLRRLWRETKFMWSVNLHKAIPEWLGAFEEEYGVLRADIHERLLQVSASTIDRILRPFKHQAVRRGGTKPGSLLRSQIPIETECPDPSMPGYLEGDTVAHCGGSLSGEFVWSLTATDICTAWTEVRVTWHKTAVNVVEQIESIRRAIPFELLVWNSDNGAEFINHALIKYFSTLHVSFTRSRAYEKNDNAHVEQKNYTHVRQLLGYDRIDNPTLITPLNEILTNEYSLLKNHFYPVRKLLRKEVVGSRVLKLYDKPLTPYERVLRQASVSDAVKQKLMETHASLNPIKLRKQVDQKIRQILRLASVTPISDSSTPAFGNI